MLPSGVPSSSVRKPRPERGPLLLMVAVALVFVVISIVPSLYQTFDPLQHYRGMRILPTSVDILHAVQVREVYDGFPTAGSAFLNAPKETPSLLPVLPQQIIGLSARVLHLDPLMLLFFVQAFLTFLLALVLSLFAFSLSGRPWISVLAASVVLFSHLTFGSWGLPGNPLPDAFVRFTTNLEVQWTFLWLLTLLFFLAQWMKQNRRRWLPGICVAQTVLMYSSPCTGLLTALVLLFLLARFISRRDLKRICDLAGCWTVILVLSTPQLMHLYLLTQQPWYLESLQRIGLVSSRFPPIVPASLAIFIGAALFSRHLWPRTWPVLPLLAFAGLLVLNQHVMTGGYLMPHKMTWYVIEPLMLLIVSLFFLQSGSDYVRSVSAKQCAGVLLMGFLIVTAVLIQRNGYNSVRPLWAKLQQSSPVIRKIGLQLRPGQVVYSQDADILAILPAYSGADIYEFPLFAPELVSPEKIEQQRYFNQWLEGVRPEQTDDKENKYRDFVRFSLKEKLSLAPLTAIVTTPHDMETPVWKMLLACTRSVFSAGGYDLRMMKEQNEPTSCLR